MSFILDALEKADKKRKTGEVPDLQTMHGLGKPRPARRKQWPFIIVALLVIQTVIISAWLLMKTEPESPDTAAIPPVAIVPAEPAPARLTKIQPQQPMVILLKEHLSQQPAQVPVEAQPPAPSVTTVIPAPEGNESTASADTPPPSLQMEEQENAATSEEPLAAEPVHQENTVEEQPPLPAQAEAAPVQRSTTVIDDSHERDELPDFSELSTSVQQELSDISISYHAYANNPASRLVSINGRVIRQGQEVKSGLMLEEITKAGVVLKFKSHRFRMDVF